MEGRYMKDGLYIVQYGTKVYMSGKHHSQDGIPFEDPNGYIEWLLNNKRHREDGPAVEYAYGTKEWWLNGKYHREDGPAIECTDGDKYWYLDNKLLEVIPQYVLENYMKANNLILAHLLTDPDPLVRESASKYKWKEVV
jgi:hypothetical protein